MSNLTFNPFRKWRGEIARVVVHADCVRVARSIGPRAAASTAARGAVEQFLSTRRRSRKVRVAR